MSAYLWARTTPIIGHAAAPLPWHRGAPKPKPVRTTFRAGCPRPESVPSLRDLRQVNARDVSTKRTRNSGASGSPARRLEEASVLNGHMPNTQMGAPQWDSDHLATPILAPALASGIARRAGGAWPRRPGTLGDCSDSPRVRQHGPKFRKPRPTLEQTPTCVGANSSKSGMRSANIGLDSTSTSAELPE